MLNAPLTKTKTLSEQSSSCYNQPNLVRGVNCGSLFRSSGNNTITNDARGKPIKYRGGVTIRLSQLPGVMIKVPNEERVGKMRERMFRMGNMPKGKGVPEISSPARRPTPEPTNSVPVV